MEQRPAPGTRILAYRGDVLEVSLTVEDGEHLGAWLRTNIGHARVFRDEIIKHVETGQPILHRNWHDIPMRLDGAGHYSLRLPLLEVGRFEAKAFCRTSRSPEPEWPAGDNVVVKVEPQEYSAGNTIYTAFVRQFGPNRFPKTPAAAERNAEHLLHEAGYAVIPPSGTFRDLIRELDHIIGRLRFRIIQLLPIHPTPTTYARMGRHFGSPFAALDFTDVDPALAEFDRRTTPMDQFLELVDAVHERGAKIFLDIPANHTGWGSRLQVEHPEWFALAEDQTFRSPSAWGVTWEDLSELDYGHVALWRWMAEVFCFWCRRGVDGFRCDAGYKIPTPVWEYIVARVRQLFPDTIFLLEGLGGPLATMEELLDRGNLDWAYSELFQNYDRAQIESYLPGCNDTSANVGILVHFAETHDNNRLAARSHRYAQMRTALTALCSHSGAFGITNGVEWLAEEKVDVHGAPTLNWGNSENLVTNLARLNSILEIHPSFRPGAELRLIQQGPENSVALLRKGPGETSPLLVLANLDDAESGSVSWDTSEFPLLQHPPVDLLTGESIAVATDGSIARIALSPGQVLCLTGDASDLDALELVLREEGESVRARNIAGRIRAKVLDIHHTLRGLEDISHIDLENEAVEFSKDPRLFCRRAAGRDAPNVITWEWPRDSKRTVPIPPRHFLYVGANEHFTVELCDGDVLVRREQSIPLGEGKHFVLLLPLDVPKTMQRLTLELTLISAGAPPRRVRAEVLSLPEVDDLRVKASFDRSAVAATTCYALCTNERGSMAQVRGAWGTVCSQYDALLAGNLHPNFPVDRRIMLTRIRGWLACRGYSQSIGVDCLERFTVHADTVVSWCFAVPAGQGKQVPIEIRLSLATERNELALTVSRGQAEETERGLGEDIPVTIILRPDLEDRVNHETTKAFFGPESVWPEATEPGEHGFRFGPSPGHWLNMTVDTGTFTSEPEWTYMVRHPFEADRGFEGSSDLFSPGYFSFSLTGDTSTEVCARICTDSVSDGVGEGYFPNSLHIREQENEGEDGYPFDEALVRAMRQFVVRRDDSSTVIAGYPWFLDWGRDTLIFLRGMIAAGMLDESRDILVQFARLESRGMLPNMIRGDDASNRDTSDAPLWFSVACADLLRAEQNDAFLDVDCGGRSVFQVLVSIAEGYRDGTPNGIRMDPESGLVFSPSHFTWMDTNHPAGSPREGYPIEIQALWHAALVLLSTKEPHRDWGELARRVVESINTLYTGFGGGFLADCLHGTAACAACNAVPDGVLRPNQLLAITLGAVVEPGLRRDILVSCEELLVPGAIRSLSNRPVAFPMPIRHEGRLVNDPDHPYWGTYSGDEDTRRKPAYHNGTAWTWLFPSYCEALYATHGEEARPAALALISSSIELINAGCVGHVPEIVDGDAPHQQRGCGAQAWGASELYRVYKILKGNVRLA